MKNLGVYCAALAGFALPSIALADVRIVPGPEPVQTYTVCNHSALYAINDRAVKLRSGGRTFTDLGSTFVIGYAPDVFLETRKLVRHSYRSLSASGVCQ